MTDGMSVLIDQLREQWQPRPTTSRDPVEMWRAVDREPDPWQRELLTDQTWVQVLVLCGRQTGKALELDTPICTPAGWTTMRDVHTGDAVFNEAGVPTIVVAESDVSYRESYKVTFSDGSEIVADGEHEWTVLDKRCRVAMQRNSDRLTQDWPTYRSVGRHGMVPRTKIVKTIDMLRQHLDDEESLYAVPACSPLSYGHEDPFSGITESLPIDPYVLGVWLGDGNSADPRVTSADPEVFQYIRDAGYEVGEPTKVKIKTKAENRRIGARRGSRKTTSECLRLMGVMNRKRIPRSYLTSSIGSRLRLLHGLMDSDGYASHTNSCEFSNTNERLVQGFVELANSLGLITTVKKKTAICYGKDCGDAWLVSFNPWFQVFSLRRKADRLNLDGGRQPRRKLRFIRGVEPVGRVEVKCISVASANKLYLAGRSMIPTHNSTVAASLALQTALEKPGSTTLIISRSLRQAAELKRKVDEFHHGLLSGGAPLKATRRGKAFRPLPWRINRRFHEEVDDDESVRDSVMAKEIGNGSRILAMPCSADTSVGFTIDLLIYDEAARIPDAVYFPMRPTVARARSRGEGGRVIALTTPNGKQGWFWEAWDRCQRAVADGAEPDWKVVRVPAGVLGADGKIRLGGCPHLTVEFLKNEYNELGSRWWRQEYGIEFVDALDQVFAQADIDRALRVVDDGLALMEDV